MLELKLAFREIAGNLRYSLFFVLNLALGLWGFILLDSFRESISSHLSGKSRELLTADIGISSLRPMTEKEERLAKEHFPGILQKSELVSFFSMVAAVDSQKSGEVAASRLSEIFAIDSQYPIYGKIVFRENDSAAFTQARNALLGSNEVWVYPEILANLGVKVGGLLRIGEKEFRITRVVTDDPASGIGSAGIAPRVYIGKTHLEELGLIQKGSRVRYQTLYQLPEKSDLKSFSTSLRKDYKAIGSIPDLKIRTHQDAGDDTGRLIGYVSDYLGLTSIVALFLAGIGSIYLLRTALNRRITSFAVLQSLGFTRLGSFRIILIELFLLGLAAAALAGLAAWALTPLLPSLLKEFLPKGFSSGFSALSLLTGTLAATLGNVLFSLPVLGRLWRIKPSGLFREGQGVTVSNAAPKMSYLLWLPGPLFYYALSIYEAHSIKVGSLFMALLLGAGLVLAFASLGIMRLIGKRKSGAANVSRNFIWKHSLKNLQRSPESSVSVFAALALGALLISLVPQIQSGLSDRLARPKGIQLPNYFLFDIQPEQKDALVGFLKTTGHPLQNPSPMVRARLSEVNGKNWVTDGKKGRTREADEEERFRSRIFSLSYRAGLSDTETLVAGKPFVPRKEIGPDDEAQVSMEVDFAKQLGFHLGDVLLFEISGVPVKGKIVNFRKVKWNSFQPLFFVVFEPGFLEDAPQTFLATMTGIPEAKRGTLQNQIVAKFPNVSLLDVSRIIEKTLGLLKQMSLAITAMAVFSVLAGLLIVFAVAQSEAEKRSRELSLLKVLGGNLSTLRALLRTEMILLAGAASFAGTFLSLAVAWSLSRWLFEMPWTPDWLVAAVILPGVPLVALVIMSFATETILRRKPLQLLKDA